MVDADRNEDERGGVAKQILNSMIDIDKRCIL